MDRTLTDTGVFTLVGCTTIRLESSTGFQGEQPTSSAARYSGRENTVITSDVLHREDQGPRDAGRHRPPDLIGEMVHLRLLLTVLDLVKWSPTKVARTLVVPLI